MLRKILPLLFAFLGATCFGTTLPATTTAPKAKQETPECQFAIWPVYVTPEDAAKMYSHELGALYNHRRDIVMCPLADNFTKSIDSTLVIDVGNDQGAIYVWVNSSLLRMFDLHMLMFSVAHEVRRVEEPILCDEDLELEKITCEHALDRFAAQVIGKNMALRILETMHTMLMHDKKTELAAVIGVRIELLRMVSDPPSGPKP